MPVIPSSPYKAPAFLKNRHLQTIFPTLFRRIAPVKYTRVRIPTPDDDFLDLDFSHVQSDRIVVILHGLEGDTYRQYMRGMVHIFNAGGYDTVSMNFRGCSGEHNNALRSYHSGETGDLETVIRYLSDYAHIHLVGFSLGGNVMLKYLGERGEHLPAQLRSAAALSVPCDLKSSSAELAKSHNRIYMRRFIRSLGAKLVAKAGRYPDQISLENFGSIRNFREFDDRYTAPIHGFNNAEEYWAASSSKQFLQHIRIPTLLINALDDPFLGKGSFPYQEAAENPFFFLETPATGGHVGFVTFRDRHYWSERRIFSFIDHHR